MSARGGGDQSISLDEEHADARRIGTRGVLIHEARADDGLIEAFSVENAKGFTLALQWHPEWRFAEHPASVAIFRGFGDACRAFQQGLRHAA